MDAVAPGLLVAQGIGRWGNWWNQELFGKPTNLPWGLEIDERTGRCSTSPPDTFHPTFLYEFIYDLALAGVLILDRQALPDQAAGALRPLRLALLLRPLLRGAAPGRPVAPLRRAAAERLGLDRRLLAARPPSSSGGSSSTAGGEPGRRSSAQRACRAGRRWPSPRAASARAASLRAVIVRELELDLDAFEGPFDLLLTLVLREELQLRDVDVADIVIAFVERLAERDELDLDACGEFLVLVAALLELKARGLFPDEEAELAELEPEEAAEELARRLEEYRRMKEAAGWLPERLETEGDRFFRLGPAPLAPRPERRLAPQPKEALVLAMRRSRPSRPTSRSRTWRCASRRSSQFLERFRSLLRRRGRFDFDQEVAGLSRVEQAVAFLALLELRKAGEIRIDQAAPFAPIRIRAGGRNCPSRRGRRQFVEAPAPPDLRRTRSTSSRARSRRCSSSPRSRSRSRSSRRPPTTTPSGSRRRSGCSGSRYARAAAASSSSTSPAATPSARAREAAEACARLFERPVERGLSQAALETLAMIAYLGARAPAPTSPASAASPPTRSSPASSSAG